MVLKRELLHHGWLLFLFAVVGSNVVLYHTTFGVRIIPQDSNGVVIGSMIDLAIISPILYVTWMRKWSWKYILMTMAAGLILMRFLIPMQYLEPFATITWVGFAIEGLLVAVELFIIVSLVKYLPRIIQTVKQSTLPVIFSFHHAVAANVKHSPVIQVICSGMLMLYFAFACWKKQPRLDDSTFTLHRKTSFIAFQVMLIHAIIIETIGIHWWLHHWSPILSYILLILNIYSVILLVGDIQAVRLNPVLVTDKKLYISLGFMKRMEIEWSNVEKLIDDPQVLGEKPTKETIEFIAKDLEKLQYTVILQLKQPTYAALFLGVKRKYSRIAIRVDEPEKFMKVILEKVA
ncbi:beta-carotene 15,15'-monooxygenase [Ornithinibacillus sp. L9]|uniref:Beta-carotene 15,15'-monooxygenase n=1 Tax=Ornithinibacillus caprae TaxID=2678566 RepID=A0A6N8FDL4_9BACI|nr:beta-carotene 15,15'-monooxygenase [Ornithinibacillus caprae]MUK87752.1 beta-carotene 15,15'-monooxygenase [Ornithinibacillus caprae]